jgi:hypothetical protein
MVPPKEEPQLSTHEMLSIKKAVAAKEEAIMFV